jgi:hypothetical protein
MKNKAKSKNQNETYTITRGIMPEVNHRRGRKPSKLGNTMRILNIGDGFVYPHTFNAATFNIQRAAGTYGIQVQTQRMNSGVLAVRVA